MLFLASFKLLLSYIVKTDKIIENMRQKGNQYD